MDNMETQLQDSQGGYPTPSPIRKIGDVFNNDAGIPLQDTDADAEQEEGEEEEEFTTDEEVPVDASDVIMIHDNVCIEIPDQHEDPAPIEAPMEPPSVPADVQQSSAPSLAPPVDQSSDHTEPVARDAEAETQDNGPGGAVVEGSMENLQSEDVKLFEDVQDGIDSEKEEAKDPNTSKGVFKVRPAIGLVSLCRFSHDWSSSQKKLQ